MIATKDPPTMESQNTTLPMARPQMKKITKPWTIATTRTTRSPLPTPGPNTQAGKAPMITATSLPTTRRRSPAHSPTNSGAPCVQTCRIDSGYFNQEADTLLVPRHGQINQGSLMAPLGRLRLPGPRAALLNTQE